MKIELLISQRVRMAEKVFNPFLTLEEDIICIKKPDEKTGSKKIQPPTSQATVDIPKIKKKITTNLNVMVKPVRVIPYLTEQKIQPRTSQAVVDVPKIKKNDTTNLNVMVKPVRVMPYFTPEESAKVFNWKVPVSSKKLIISEISQCKVSHNIRKPLTEIDKMTLVKICVDGTTMDVTRALTEGKLLVNDSLVYCWSALQHACYNGRDDIVVVLLKAGADPNFRRYDDMDVLMSTACSPLDENNGVLKCAHIILEAGGIINAIQMKKITPLIFAVKRGHVQMVKYFLENGANVDHRDATTRSPLNWAALNGQTNITRLLLKFGANVLQTNKFGETPLDIAVRENHKSIVDMLSKVLNTKWCPGKDPKLLQIINQENLDQLVEIKKKWKVKKMDENLNYQLELTLLGCGLDKYYQNFQKHKISYLDFLRLSHRDLEEIGISEIKDRNTLCKKIKDISSTAFTDIGKIKPEKIRRNIIHSEKVNIISNIESHLIRMCGDTESKENCGITKLDQLVLTNPLSLQDNSNSNPVKNMIAAAEEVDQSCLLLTEKVEDLIIKYKGRELNILNKNRGKIVAVVKDSDHSSTLHKSFLFIQPQFINSLILIVGILSIFGLRKFWKINK